MEEGTGIEDTAYDIEPEPSDTEPKVKHTNKIPNCKVRLQLDAEWWSPREGLKVLPNKFVSLQVGLMGCSKEPLKYFFEHPDLRKEYRRCKHLQSLHPSLPPDLGKTSTKPHPPIQPAWEGSNGIVEVLTLLQPREGPYKLEELPQGDSGEGESGSQLTYHPLDRKHTNHLSDEVLERMKLYTTFYDLEVNVFYSFADLVAWLGRPLGGYIAERLKTGKTLKTIEGWLKLPLILTDYSGIPRLVRLKIVDWYGLEYTSLKNTAAVYNVKIPSKNLMDSYKSKMHEAYLNDEIRADFVEYALSDLIMDQLEREHQKVFHQLCSMVGVSYNRPIPMTKGAKVANIFKAFLEQVCPVPEDFHAIADVPVNPQAKRTVFELLREYGCKALLHSNEGLTEGCLGVVQGGRIKHEIPSEASWPEAILASMDLVSCYGQTLKHLFIPIGHPVKIFFPIHHPTEWLTLGEFLKKWGSELVPHCWHAVIDTVDEELSFSQNLIYSKDLGPKGIPELIAERIVGREPNTDKSHVRGDFILLERQIKNGVLTHSLLTGLQNYSSNREWGELSVKVRVKAAMVFPKSLMIDYKGRETFVDWMKSLRSQASSNRVRTMSNQTGYCITDQRVGPWVKFPLEQFMGPLISKRTELKAKMKNAVGDQRDIYNAQQTSVKGVVNTTYGILASPLFDTSNPCVANNITCMPRVASWMMAAASRGIKTITDGTEFDLNGVRFYKDYGPSLNTIAFLGQKHLLSRRTRSRIVEAPLGSGGDKNLRWELVVEDSQPKFRFKGVCYTQDEGIKLIETLYREHVHNFFHIGYGNRSSPADTVKYDMTWFEKFGIECKLIGRGYAAHGLGDYIIGSLIPGGRVVMKARGHKLDSEHYNPTTGSVVQPPMKVLLHNLLEEKPLKAGVSAVCFKILTPGEFKRRPNLRLYDLLPGDTTSSNVKIKLITLSEFTYPTLTSYREWEVHYKNCQRYYGVGLESSYIEPDTFLLSENIEEVKKDIQRRITKFQKPKMKIFVKKSNV